MDNTIPAAVTALLATFGVLWLALIVMFLVIWVMWTILPFIIVRKFNVLIRETRQTNQVLIGIENRMWKIQRDAHTLH
jgi:hypothetical protein